MRTSEEESQWCFPYIVETVENTKKESIKVNVIDVQMAEVSDYRYPITKGQKLNTVYWTPT